jgi:hypothetical protein
MDRQILTVLADHATILSNQEYVIGQLTHQHDCLEKLKNAVAASTEVTEEVRELLSAFKVVGSLTKWGAVTGAAGLSLWHGARAALQFWK